MSVRITCELGCGKVIAEAQDRDTAAEMAEEADAFQDLGDEGSGDWECSDCRDKRYQEGMAEAQRYDREMQIAAIERECRDAQDAILSYADQMYDEARERGII